MYLLEQIHGAANRSPDKPAIVYHGEAFTYGQFWRLIDGCRAALSAHLPEQGVAVVCVANMLEAWIICLAVRALGMDAASISRDDQLTAIDGLEADCLITLESEAGGMTAPSHLRRLALSNPSRQARDADTPLPPMPAPARWGGQVLLTSGTTGSYKRVLRQLHDSAASIEQRRLRYVEFEQGFTGIGRDTVLSIFDMPPWTGAGYSWTIFIWCLGGAVVIQQSRDWHLGFCWPGLTHAVAHPHHITQTLSQPDGVVPFNPNLLLIVVAGTISPAVAREIKRRLTPRILINLSSTEIGGWGLTLVESDADLRWHRVDPGRVVQVVDELDQPMSSGQMGRVRIALEPTNATGYLGDPTNSAAAFSGEWFYSGDLGILDGSGRLALLGRTTEVVHVKGDKFSAEPWERALRDKLGCEDVCILSGSWRSDVERLHVFIESRQPIPSGQLQAAVQSVLWGFAGCEVHLVGALPRTETGKVKRFVIAKAIHEGAFPAQAPVATAVPNPTGPDNP